MRRSEVPKNLLLDSGFWYALYDVRDPFHEQADAFAKYLDFYTLVIPWPSLYETLNTRFVRHPEWLTFPLCCFDQISCWFPRDTQ